MAEIITTTIVLFSIATALITVSIWSGWNRLAHNYRLRGRRRGNGQRWTFLNARMGRRKSDTLFEVPLPLCPFRNCVNIGANENGLYISLFAIFRPFHPPLLIPWEHISAKEADSLFLKWIEFRFRDSPDVAFWLPDSVGRDILRFAPEKVACAIEEH